MYYGDLMTVYFENSDIYRVQQATEIVEVISEHVSLSKKGREMVGLCPFHDDHRPSLYVSGVKQIFKCFACGAGGDVFKFVQMRENLTFGQAVERLAERAGITIEQKQQGKVESKTARVDPNKLAKANAWAMRHYQANLFDEKRGKKARGYLAERQIPLEVAKKWKLGVAGEGGNDLIKAAVKQIPGRLLREAGLVTGKSQSNLSDKFVNRLMFPITDVTGRVIGFGGRTLSGHDAKYVNSPTTVLFDKSNCLYGLEEARHEIVSSGTAVVVEGYTDCIMAHQKGCRNVVATLGTSFTTGQARILKRYAKKIVLIFDSDAAGIEASNRALQVCVGQRIDVKVASVPQEKDPCDFLLSFGREAFEKLIAGAEDVFAFKWRRLTEKFSKKDTLVDNKAAIEEFLETIATAIRSGSIEVIERGLIVNRLSKIMGLNSREINTELSKRLRRVERSNLYGLKNRKVQSVDLGKGFFAAAQREILEVLLNEPKLFETIPETVTPEVFNVPVLREIADTLFETLKTESEASLARIMANAESVEAGRVIVELALRGEEKGNFNARLKGALEAVQRYLSEQKKTEIKTMDDSTQFLRRFSEHTEKRNPHNIGMVQ